MRNNSSTFQENLSWPNVSLESDNLSLVRLTNLSFPSDRRNQSI